MINYNLDVHGNTNPIQKYWSFCIGSCHAHTVLRADVREQLKQAKEECGFKFIRFHGLFDDEMSVVNKDIFGNVTYSFFNIDNIFDYLLSIGMKPFVEIGFMPKALASGTKTLFHYQCNVTLPKNYIEWNEFISIFINHLLDRYGKKEVESWYFEFWNEPNIAEDLGNFGGQFLDATKEEYFYFFKETFKTIKCIDENIKMGGPATSNNKWVKDFIEYCENNGLKIDFVSTHQYPADIIVCSDYGKERIQKVVTTFKNDPMKALNDFIKFKTECWKDVPRGILTTMAKKVKEESKDYKLFYTEWSSLGGLPSDGPFGSSFIIKSCLDNLGIIDGYSYWCLSDIFEETPQKSEEFHGGYGIFTYHGIKKAPYNAFKMLNLLPDKIYESNYLGKTLDIHSFKGEKNECYILLNNHNSLQQNIEDEEVTITLDNNLIKKVEKYVIDDDHSNAYSYFLEKYNKNYLSCNEIKDVKKHQELYVENEIVSSSCYNVKVKKQGTILLKITY